ncbi:5-oxoprolinase subunit PxpB [Agaribacterium haliotis]|uniref:5-oxoprolinase subunit PxpB n=1 Tax=Agaribacterium haliotis TaxID=2013869 RepID=UPI000BB561AB|nr:5-oxoprolinase subunit PxpB [Agaribacterium haliotis]
MTPYIRQINESALHIDFALFNSDSDELSQSCTDALLNFTHWLKQQNWPVIEIVPAYRSALVQFDFARAKPQQFIAAIEQWLTNYSSVDQVSTNEPVLTLPCLYSERVAPDLIRLAQAKGLSTAELIQLHISRSYRVFCIGFSPGFPYLGWVAPQLASPRLARPRIHVAAGSVGIADRQTGIYPQAGPGGWNIIGRCPLQLFNAERAQKCLLKPGQHVRFEAIDEARFIELGGQLES